MADIYPPRIQRAALLALAGALGCRNVALRRDACGDWAIFGKCGHIYAVPGSLDRPKTPGFQILVAGAFSSGRWWGAAKRGLSFAETTNDGDDEGALFLDRLPTPAEAEAIRHYLGIAKKREISAAERERLMEAGRQFQKRAGVEEPLDGEKPASEVPAGRWASYAPAGIFSTHAPAPAWTPR